MSKYATKEQLISIVQDMASKISVPTIGIGGGYAPIGTIISYMGVTAPQDYLACDGSVYNISAYPDLADFIESQFGSKNYFGGNGTTTFGVPTLTGAPTNAIYCIKAKAIGYSTDEHVVEKWVDGKDVYEKTIECEALPNNTTKSVAHGVSNLDKIVDIKGCAYRSSDGLFVSLPRVATSTTYMCEINVNSGNVNITSSTDLSAFGWSYVTIQYTKTA